MSFKIKLDLPDDAKEIHLMISWDGTSKNQQGYVCHISKYCSGFVTHFDEIVLSDWYNDKKMEDVVHMFAVEYLPDRYRDCNHWDFKAGIARVEIPVGYFLDQPEEKYKSKIRSQVFSPAGTESGGYALWNDCDHLCVDVPDGVSTISCKLSDGRQITFGFTPYELNGIPKCVDIRDLGDPLNDKMKTGSDQYRQNLIGFSGGGTAFRTSKLEKLTTLVTLLFKTGESK